MLAVEGEPEIVVRLHQARVERECPAIRADGPRGIALHLQHAAEVVVHRCRIWPQRQGSPVLFGGGRQASLLQQEVSKNPMGFEMRLAREHPPEGFSGLAQVPLRLQGKPQIDLNVHVIRRQRQGALVRSDGFLRASLCLQGKREIALCLEVIGSCLKGATDQRHSGVWIAALQCEHAEPMKRFRMIWFSGENTTVDVFRLSQPAGFLMRDRLLELRCHSDLHGIGMTTSIANRLRSCASGCTCPTDRRARADACCDRVAGDFGADFHTFSPIQNMADEHQCRALRIIW